MLPQSHGWSSAYSYNTKHTCSYLNTVIHQSHSSFPLVELSNLYIVVIRYYGTRYYLYNSLHLDQLSGGSYSNKPNNHHLRWFRSLTTSGPQVLPREITKTPNSPYLIRLS